MELCEPFTQKSYGLSKHKWLHFYNFFSYKPKSKIAENLAEMGSNFWNPGTREQLLFLLCPTVQDL